MTKNSVKVKELYSKMLEVSGEVELKSAVKIIAKKVGLTESTVRGYLYEYRKSLGEQLKFNRDGSDAKGKVIEALISKGIVVNPKNARKELEKKGYTDLTDLQIASILTRVYKKNPQVKSIKQEIRADKLVKRYNTISKMFNQGKSDKEIGAKLGLNEGTICETRGKLGLRKRDKTINNQVVKIEGIKEEVKEIRERSGVRYDSNWKCLGCDYCKPTPEVKEVKLEKITTDELNSYRSGSVNTYDRKGNIKKTPKTNKKVEDKVLVIQLLKVEELVNCKKFLGFTYSRTSSYKIVETITFIDGKDRYKLTEDVPFTRELLPALALDLHSKPHTTRLVDTVMAYYKAKVANDEIPNFNFNK